jgi:hypothetical protein
MRVCLRVNSLIFLYYFKLEFVCKRKFLYKQFHKNVSNEITHFMLRDRQSRCDEINSQPSWLLYETLPQGTLK